MRLGHICCVLVAAALASACATSVDPTNPFDPSASGEKQAKGNVKGSVALERSDDPSGVLVSLEGTSLTATTGSGGSFTLTGVKSGVYALLVTKEGYRQERVSGVSVPVGDTVDLGMIAVAVARGVVSGSVSLAGLQDHGGAVVTLKETTGQQAQAISHKPTAIRLRQDCVGQVTEQVSGFRLWASGPSRRAPASSVQHPASVSLTQHSALSIQHSLRAGASARSRARTGTGRSRRCLRGSTSSLFRRRDFRGGARGW
ncbi:MAG: carboxypeptidase regulatory-like domain-containing protein [Deltaproteobacteria bacterium]|nr:carboxypeptidase regulatory-like domain-containing protein [Deltaproteobacteria bacterium]